MSKVGRSAFMDVITFGRRATQDGRDVCGICGKAHPDANATIEHIANQHVADELPEPVVAVVQCESCKVKAEVVVARGTRTGDQLHWNVMHHGMTCKAPSAKVVSILGKRAKSAKAKKAKATGKAAAKGAACACDAKEPAKATVGAKAAGASAGKVNFVLK